ncbi:MAG: hypothetical protein D9V45_03160 [Chloroflexi bacterium]|nr:MAG: hypothetical protein D9V45_03160 [Chloroflexota bacterium]
MNEKKMSIFSSKWVSLILMVLGTAILITLFVFLVVGFPGPKSVDRFLPEQIAGYQLSKQISGSEAVEEFAQLHGKHLAVTSGAKGIYGEWNAVTLWVAATDTTERAKTLLVDMELKISEGRSPFTFKDPIQDGDRTVYSLDGMGQSHFFFQSGKNLVWLSANPNIADQSLKQVLEYYP